MKDSLFPALALIAFLVIVVAGTYFFSQKSETSTVEIPTENTATQESSNSSETKNNMHRVTLKTNHGEIVFETYDIDASKAVTNFLTLADKGFYNGLTFHRVIPGFMIQGGDPSGNGTGGPGYSFEDELNPNTPSAKEGYKRGVVAMANAGPDTNGSQFFIMHKDYPLPHNYTIFGKVVSGIAVVDAIASVKIGSNDMPLEKVVMETVTTEEVK